MAGNVGASTTGTHGSMTVEADGGYSYTLDQGDPQVSALDDGETLTDSFTYTIGDGDGGSDQAALTITIDGKTPAPPPPPQPANEPPVAADDSGRTPKNTAITFTSGDLLGNDSDPDGDDLKVTGVGDATDGSVSLDADGNAVFTPDPGFTGTGTFTYTIADPDGATADATVTVEVPASPPEEDDNTRDDGTENSDDTPDEGAGDESGSAGGAPGDDSGPSDDSPDESPNDDSTGSGGASDDGPADESPDDTGGPAAPPPNNTGNGQSSPDGGDGGGTGFFGGGDADGDGGGDVGASEPGTGPNAGESRPGFIAGDLPDINPVRLIASLEDRVMPRDGIQEFNLPPNAFEHTDPTEELRVVATRADGSPLPNYIEFDNENQKFVIDGDAAEDVGVEQLGVRVTATDTSQNDASTTFTIKFTDKVRDDGAPSDDAPSDAAAEGDDTQARAPTGKPNLSDQLGQTGRQAFLAERGDFLADVAAMFEAAA